MRLNKCNCIPPLLPTQAQLLPKEVQEQALPPHGMLRPMATLSAFAWGHM